MPLERGKLGRSSLLITSLNADSKVAFDTGVPWTGSVSGDEVCDVDTEELAGEARASTWWFVTLEMSKSGQNFLIYIWIRWF